VNNSTRAFSNVLQLAFVRQIQPIDARHIYEVSVRNLTNNVLTSSAHGTPLLALILDFLRFFLPLSSSLCQRTMALISTDK